MREIERDRESERIYIYAEKCMNLLTQTTENYNFQNTFWPAYNINSI